MKPGPKPGFRRSEEARAKMAMSQMKARLRRQQERERILDERFQRLEEQRETYSVEGVIYEVTPNSFIK